MNETSEERIVPSEVSFYSSEVLHLASVDNFHFPVSYLQILRKSEEGSTVEIFCTFGGFNSKTIYIV